MLADHVLKYPTCTFFHSRYTLQWIPQQLMMTEPCFNFLNTFPVTNGSPCISKDTHIGKSSFISLLKWWLLSLLWWFISIQMSVTLWTLQMFTCSSIRSRDFKSTQTINPTRCHQLCPYTWCQHLFGGWRGSRILVKQNKCLKLYTKSEPRINTHDLHAKAALPELSVWQYAH